MIDEQVDYTYGFCPRCGVPGINRERRPNGNDSCFNGHVYPSREAKNCPPPPEFEARIKEISEAIMGALNECGYKKVSDDD